MAVTTLHRKTSRVHNIPFPFAEIILLNRVQIPIAGRISKYHNHSVSLIIVDIRYHSRSVPGYFQGAAHQVTVIAGQRFNGYVLPCFGTDVEGPDFGSRPPVSQNSPVQKYLIAVDHSGVTVSG